MPDRIMKANDLLPAVRVQLTLDGQVVDLTNARRVDFILNTKPLSPPKVNAAMVIEDAPEGIVRYDWVLGDTDTPGSYQAEFEVTWNDGKPQTFPTKSYRSIDVVADLDSGGA